MPDTAVFSNDIVLTGSENAPNNSLMAASGWLDKQVPNFDSIQSMRIDEIVEKHLGLLKLTNSLQMHRNSAKSL